MLKNFVNIGTVIVAPMGLEPSRYWITIHFPESSKDNCKFIFVQLGMNESWD